MGAREARDVPSATGALVEFGVTVSAQPVPADFQALVQAVTTAIGQGRFDDAEALLTASADAYPDEQPTMLYMWSCVSARLGQPEAAIRFIDAALARGYWYGERLLRESPSWQSLQGTDDFEVRVQQSLARASVMAAGHAFEVREPARRRGASPMLMVLHSNGASARREIDAWQPGADWLVVAPQSTQGLMTDAAIWDDQSRAMADLAHVLELVSERYRIDEAHVAIAGFSMGAETALRAALRAVIPAQAFVLFGPGGPTITDPDGWDPLIEGGRNLGLRGRVMVGEFEDPELMTGAERTAAKLGAAGIPCRLERVPGARHALPPDLPQRLQEALTDLYAGGGSSLLTAWTRGLQVDSSGAPPFPVSSTQRSSIRSSGS